MHPRHKSIRNGFCVGSKGTAQIPGYGRGMVQTTYGGVERETVHAEENPG